MPNIYSAFQECCFEGRKILFDTNVWIAIYGNDPRQTRAVYSNYYASALKRGNTICVNEQVVSEYFNRTVKIEYEDLFGKAQWHRFKERRQVHEEFRERIESVRDTCLNIIDDCIFFEGSCCQATLYKRIHDATMGTLDLTDLALVKQCTEHGLVFVTHDKDFANTDIELVTANQHILRNLV